MNERRSLESRRKVGGQITPAYIDGLNNLYALIRQEKENYSEDQLIKDMEDNKIEPADKQKLVEYFHFISKNQSGPGY